MSEKIYTILSINPGSTSTKIAVYKNETIVIENTVRHSTAEIEKYDSIIDQKGLRSENIAKTLEEANISLEEIDVVVGRGGLIKPLESGTYAINDTMIKDLQGPSAIIHASCLGGLIAKEIGDKLNIPSFIVDPVVVDEFEECSRLSGNPLIQRRSAFHALNQKATARRYSKEIGKNYEDLNLVVAHLGGGISVGAHKRGRVVDVFDAVAEGTFSPERCGSIPTYNIIELAFSGKHEAKELLSYQVGKGGLVAYLGTSDLREVEQMITDGDKKSKLVFDAMVHQIAKDIGAMCAVLDGEVDAILLTGGVAYSKMLVKAVLKKIGKFAEVNVYPGEGEMLALTEGALRVMRGETPVKEYKG